MGETLHVRHRILKAGTARPKRIAVKREIAYPPDDVARIHVRKELALLAREVKFMANGGTLSGEDTVRAFLGKTFASSGVTFPIAIGPSDRPPFDGWFTEADGGERKTENDVFSGFDRLYAQYRSFTVDLRDQWYLHSGSSTDPNGNPSPLRGNPDPNRFDGVYSSYGHWNQLDSIDVMRITLDGYTTFRLYIRSDSESDDDYVVVGQIDQEITTYPFDYVKATTSGSQQDGQDLASYQEVVFTAEDGLTTDTHFIDICYQRGPYNPDGYDRGYVLIPKDQ